MTRDLRLELPSRREGVIFIFLLLIWLLVTGLFIGMRPEHFLMGALMTLMFFAHGQSRKLLVALLPFALFGISYDWMNLLPNYEVNEVDIKPLYEAEKTLFGISTGSGILTPNEFFQIHNCTVADFLAGIFYLCWVPVPIAFGLGMYLAGQRNVGLRFAWAFLFVNLIGFCGYYIHPAAPPWYVASHGFEFHLGTPGDVAGLGRFDELIGIPVFQGLYGRNANVFAAVPSLHSAYMVITFIYSLKARCHNIIRGIFFVIMLGIWFTAVYTSHHYCIDAILGASCAVFGVAIFEYMNSRSSRVGGFFESYTRYIS